MAFEDYKQKKSVVLVYTGEGKGKTTASLGLMLRALGDRKKVAFIQFIKFWGVSEHIAIRDIMPIYGDQLYFYKGGKGFFNAGELSEKHISAYEHKKAARDTYKKAFRCAASGDYDLVICDEINNAVHDKLITEKMLGNLILNKAENTSLCLTGRHFPMDLIDQVDIATNMDKMRHHFDQKFLANKGIDF